jgi:hypothetical protein
MPVTHVPVVLTDVTAYTVKAANSGLVHYIPDLTGDCTITPPAPKAGLWFEFAYAGAAADAQDWIINTGTNTNYFKGGVVHLDSDADAAGDEVVAVLSDGNSNSKLTVNVPNVGTRVRIECADGVTWNVSGYVVAATAPAFADQ